MGCACRGDKQTACRLKTPLPAVGGPKDLVIGTRQTWAMTEHVSESGEPMLVPRCTHPILGFGFASRVNTDLAVLKINAAEIVFRAQAGDVDFSSLQVCSDGPFLALRSARAFNSPCFQQSRPVCAAGLDRSCCASSGARQFSRGAE